MVVLGFTAPYLARIVPLSELVLKEHNMPNVSVGQPAPTFVLPDEQGRPWVLTRRLCEGPAVLVFYRGDW